jgi:hypothetical protein
LQGNRPATLNNLHTLVMHTEQEHLTTPTRCVDDAKPNDPPCIQPQTPDHVLLLLNRRNTRTLTFNTNTQAWSQMPSPARPRRRCAAATFGSSLYVVGGADSQQRVDTVIVFDVKRARWVDPQFPPISVCRLDCAAIVQKNELVVCGGIGEDGTLLSSVEVLNFASRQWTTLSNSMVNLVNPRWLFTLVGDSNHNSDGDNQLIVLGGLNEMSNNILICERHSAARGTELLQLPLDHPKAAAVDASLNRLYIIGDQINAITSTIDVDQPSIFMCDVSAPNDPWVSLDKYHPLPRITETLGTEQSPMPERCAAAAADGKLYVCFDESSFVFDSYSRQWTALPSHSTSCWSPSCFVLAG